MSHTVVEDLAGRRPGSLSHWRWQAQRPCRAAAGRHSLRLADSDVAAGAGSGWACPVMQSLQFKVQVNFKARHGCAAAALRVSALSGPGQLISTHGSAAAALRVPGGPGPGHGPTGSDSHAGESLHWPQAQAASATVTVAGKPELRSLRDSDSTVRPGRGHWQSGHAR